MNKKYIPVMNVKYYIYKGGTINYTKIYKTTYINIYVYTHTQ